MQKLHKKFQSLTFGGCGGAGVIVTAGDKSLTPGGNPTEDLPKEFLCGGCGTDRFVRFSGVDPDMLGTCIFDLTGEGC